MTHTSRGYARKSAWVRNLKAKDIMDARDIALSKHSGKMCVDISMIWLNHS
jgi:hypothetical protein